MSSWQVRLRILPKPHLPWTWPWLHVSTALSPEHHSPRSQLTCSRDLQDPQNQGSHLRTSAPAASLSGIRHPLPPPHLHKVRVFICQMSVSPAR